MFGYTMKIGFAGLVLVAIAVILLLLVGPMIHSLQEAAKIAEFREQGREAELAEFLRSELRSNRIADPYDPRWWGKRVNGVQYNRLENALEGFLNDSERDGRAEDALYQALEMAGIHVTNLEDAVHAVNHIVHKSKVPDGEPLPEQIKEDYNNINE